MIHFTDENALPSLRRFLKQQSIFACRISCLLQSYGILYDFLSFYIQTDENGAPAATCDKEIFYQLWGDGEILGVENGKKDDLTPYSARFRSTFRGRALVYVRAGTVPGPLKLFAYTKCGLSAEVHLREDENEA